MVVITLRIASLGRFNLDLHRDPPVVRGQVTTSASQSVRFTCGAFFLHTSIESPFQKLGK